MVGAAIGVVFGMVNQFVSTSALTQALSIDVTYRPSALALAFAGLAFGLTLPGSVPPAARAARLGRGRHRSRLSA